MISNNRLQSDTIESRFFEEIEAYSKTQSIFELKDSEREWAVETEKVLSNIARSFDVDLSSRIEVLISTSLALLGRENLARLQVALDRELEKG
jgi:hypothetical protein